MTQIPEGNLMFNPDRPIKHLSEDLLDRKTLAKFIGEAILKSQTKDSLVIGLLGEWGSGKTSLVNMIVEHIGNISNSYEPEEKPVIVDFNPWIFSEQNQLIDQFFNQLSLSLGRIDYSSNLKKASNSLKNYAKMFKPLTYVPSIGQAASIALDACEVVAEATKSSGELLEKDLSGIKKDLSNLLENQDGKIIIVIDDIDRLNDREIRQVFQLVKSLADFPNTIYLLTFDKKIVTDALGKDQPGHETEYLEKIVQVPLDIPLISKNELETLLTNQLDMILENVQESEFNRLLWGNLYQSGFKHFFENIRDVTRYINVLRFNYELVKDEVNPADFLAITAIQVFVPEVYQKIRENKEVFTSISTTFDKAKPEYKQICDEIVSSVDPKVKKFLLNYLEVLFPNINAFYGGFFHDISFKKSWRIDRRVCSEDFFDVYFKLSIPNWEISQSEMKLLIEYGNNREKFTNKLVELMESGKILRFLAIFPDHASKIKQDNIENIVSSILDIGDLFPDDESIFYGTPMRINIIISFLLKRLPTQNQRFDVLKNSMNKNTNSLYTFVWEVDCLDELHGRYRHKETKTSEEDLIISSKQLDELESLACNKIKSWDEEGRLEKHKKILPILQIWKQWREDETEIESVIKKIIECDNNLINFISNCISPVHSMSINDYVGKTSWNISFKAIEDFIDLNVVESRLKDINASGKLETMNDKEKLAVKLFLENIDEYKLNPDQKTLPFN
jgi:predicted KAP-like P-loop ATPase